MNNYDYEKDISESSTSASNIGSILPVSTIKSNKDNAFVQNFDTISENSGE